jgi:hypothetical protein
MMKSAMSVAVPVEECLDNLDARGCGRHGDIRIAQCFEMPSFRVATASAASTILLRISLVML